MELHAARPLIVGEVMLITIEQSGVQSDSSKMGGWLSAFKEAYAVVVCDTHGIRALGMDSAEIDVDDLMREVPDLDDVLVGR